MILLTPYKHYYEQIDGKTIDITDEIPFDIPETWEWCRLAPLLHYLSTGPFGSALHKRDYVQGGIPLINPMHIDMEKAIITPSDNARISPETAERLSAYKLSIGDIVIARRGEMGRAAIITEKEQGWLCGTGSFFLHFSSLFFNDYFINFIHTPYSKKQLGGTAVGTTMCNLNHKILSDLLIPIPPLTEQKRIVSQIEVLFAEVDEIDKDSADLESALSLAKQKVLDLAIRGKLVPQNTADEPASELLKRIKAEKEALVRAGKIKRDRHESYIFRGDDNCYYEQLMQETVDISDEIPFELPDSWSWCRFSTLVNFVMGKTPARSQKEFWDMPFLPWVSIADMIPGGVIKKTKEFISSNALSHCFSNRISPAGTLMMSFKLTIGRVSILNMPAQHNEAIISIFPFVDQENIHRDYLLKILPVMVDFVKKSPAIKGNTLNSDSLSKMLIPLPPLAEQERIVSCITQFETILKSIQE